jgi:hypothetical protein
MVIVKHVRPIMKRENTPRIVNGEGISPKRSTREKMVKPHPLIM